jgi:hypothetical protein
MEGGKMWLNDLIHAQPKSHKSLVPVEVTTLTTSKNHVGHHESLVPVEVTTMSDIDDTKNAMGSSPEGKGMEQTTFVQVSSKNPEYVRHLILVDGTTSDPTPEQIAHARRMLVDCPETKGKLHCWHCSRCDRARRCTAWRIRRNDVEFFRQSEKPYSLFLVESGAVEVVQ